MSIQTNIALPVSKKQVFDLVQKLTSSDKKKLIYLLEQEAYIADIPEQHKEIVRKRLKKYAKNPEQLVSETQALKAISKM